MNSRGFPGWGRRIRPSGDSERVGVLESLWVRVELELDAVEGEGGVCGNGPFVLASGAVDSLCDEARGERERNVVRALHEDERNGGSGLSWSPFDSVS